MELAQRPYATLKFNTTPESPPALKKPPFSRLTHRFVASLRVKVVLRTQEIMSVPGHKQFLMYCNPRAQLEKIRESPLTMFICLHIHRKKLAGLINPIVKAYRAGKKAPESTYTCGRCHTDFRIEMCEYGTELALIITKWFNLGDGLSPDDPRWKRHAESADRVHTGEVRRSPSDGNNSPRVCFENASPRSLAALRSCNLLSQK